ncbi:MAG: DUF4189 domain-containing protein, partial [Alphaproteobacteria bacterium]
MLKGVCVLLACMAIATPAWAGDLYATIAYSETDGQWGFAYDYGSESVANREALGHCRSAGGGSCEVAVRVANGCGAIATTSNPRDWSGETGLSRSAAESAALAKCARF